VRGLFATAFAGLLAASTPAVPPAQPVDSKPTVTTPTRDRWMWNARERTAAGRAALQKGDAQGAIDAFDVARRLRPEDPRTAYNAGTARIGSDPKAAAPLLDGAAQAAGPQLAPSAWYNLGNARLAAGDAKGAVDSFVEALRREPQNADAKQNLELALRAMAEQQKQQQQQSETSGDTSKQQPKPGDSKPEKGDSESEPSQQEGSESKHEPGSDSSSKDASSEPGESSGQPSNGGADQRQNPLPQFRDLPDMTAEQAAAILRAVEDLERKQRHDKALKAAQQRATVEKDW